MSQELEVELNEIRHKFARNLSRLYDHYKSIAGNGGNIVIPINSLFFDFASLHAFERFLKEGNIPHKLDYDSDYDGKGSMFREPSFIFRFS